MEEAERLAKAESEIDNLKNRVNTHGREIDDLRLKSTRMDTLLGRIDSTVTKIDAKMDEQQAKPAKKWESLVAQCIGIVVAALFAIAFYEIGVNV